MPDRPEPPGVVQPLDGAGLDLPEAVLQALQHIRELDRARREGPLLCLPEAAARFLHMLARMVGARRAAEFGTSAGWSGIWIASALRANAGDQAQLVTCERDPARAQLARRHFQQAGLAPYVTLLQGEARELVASLQGPFELAFIDCDKDDYVALFRGMLPKMARPSVVVADNIHTHREQLGPFMREVRRAPGVLSLEVPIGNGLELALLA